MALHKHKLEKELKEKISIILRNIGEAVMVTDNRGLITSMNAVAEDLTGWTQEQALGKDLLVVFNLNNKESSINRRNSKASRFYENVNRHKADYIHIVAKDGKEIPINFCCRSIQSNNGDTAGIVIVFSEVSQNIMQAQNRKRLANELQDTLSKTKILSGLILFIFRNNLSR